MSGYALQPPAGTSGQTGYTFSNILSFLFRVLHFSVRFCYNHVNIKCIILCSTSIYLDGTQIHKVIDANAYKISTITLDLNFLSTLKYSNNKIIL